MSFLIVPDYLTQYHCKCGACRKSCCISGSWDITLTQEEYQKTLEKPLRPELRSHFASCVKLDPHGGRDSYAKVGSKDGYKCVFLEDSGLCQWQRLTGCSIGTVCRDFPNKYVGYLDDEYVFPTCACEAITEILIERKEPITFRKESRVHVSRHYINVTQEQCTSRPLLKNYQELTQAFIGILQDRTRTIDERIRLFAAASYVADRVEKDGLGNKLVPIIRSLRENGEANDFVQGLSSAPMGPMKRTRVLIEAYSLFLMDPVYGNTVKHVLNSIGVETEQTQTDQQALLHTDENVCVRQWEKNRVLWDKRSCLIENIMVSLIMYHVVPFGNPGIWECSMLVVIFYVLLKGGMMGILDSISDDTELADFIVSVHRMFSHNSYLFEIAIERIIELRLDNLPEIFALIGE